MMLVISGEGELGGEVRTPVSELPNPMWLFSFHSVLSKVQTASRVMEDLMPIWTQESTL